MNIRDYMPAIYQDVPYLKAYFDATQEVIYDEIMILCQKILDLRNPDLIEEDFLGSLMRLLGFFVPFTHLTVPDRRRLISDLPFFYETSGTPYFIKFLSYNIGAKVQIFNLYTNKQVIDQTIMNAPAGTSMGEIIGLAPISPSNSQIPNRGNSDTPVIAKGFIGNLVFGMNQDSTVAILQGSVRVTGTVLHHPDGIPRAITPPIQINTQWYAPLGRIGYFYLMWTDELPETRFVAGGVAWWTDNGGTNEKIIPVRFDPVQNKWFATPAAVVEDTTNYPEEEFIPLITDLLIVEGRRESSASSGISSLTNLVASFSITGVSEIFNDSGENHLILEEEFKTDIDPFIDATTGVLNYAIFDSDTRRLKMHLENAAGGNHPEVRYSFPTVIGAAYSVETYIADRTPNALVSLTLNVGTSAGGTQYGTVARTVEGHYARVLFIATTITAHVSLRGPQANDPADTWVEYVRVAQTGRLYSNNNGTGTIDYKSGLFTITFGVAPGLGNAITTSMFTQIYQNLIPLTDVPGAPGSLVQNGGSWYLTNFVGVDYDLLKFPSLRDLADIFYRIAPVPLVLHTIQTSIIEETEVGVGADAFVIEVIEDNNIGQVYPPPDAVDIGSVDGTDVDDIEINVSN